MIPQHSNLFLPSWEQLQDAGEETRLFHHNITTRRDIGGKNGPFRLLGKAEEHGRQRQAARRGGEEKPQKIQTR